MQDNIYSIKLSLQDPQCRKLFESTINADDAFEVLNPKSPQHPDLLVYELRANPIEELNRIEELLSSGKLKDVFLYSPVKDPDVLLKIIKIGLKEFFAE